MQEILDANGKFKRVSSCTVYVAGGDLFSISAILSTIKDRRIPEKRAMPCRPTPRGTKYMRPYNNIKYYSGLFLSRPRVMTQGGKTTE